MKIIITTKRPDNYSCKELTRSFSRLGPVTVTDLVDGANGEIFDSLKTGPSLIIHRKSSISSGKADYDLLEKESARGVVIINSLEALKIFGDKNSTQLALEKLKCPTLPTLSFSRISRSKFDLIVNSTFGPGPYVVSPWRGMQGIGVMKFLDKNSLWDFWEFQIYRSDLEYIVRPFIEKKCEWRPYFINKKCVGVLKKVGMDFKANYRFARDVSFYSILELSKSLRATILNFVNNTELFYGAFDIIEGVDGHFIIDVASVCGFEEFDSLSKNSFSDQLAKECSNLKIKQLSLSDKNFVLETEEKNPLIDLSF